jgi:glyoxylase-like metal-dependent hydrolase (beta-lactamase superfamily II)
MKKFWFAMVALAGSLTAQPAYEIYGIRYATIKDFSVAGLVAGADPLRKQDIAMYVWLIKGGGKNILFDCGFYRDKFIRRWHPSEFVKPSDSVQAAGVNAAAISDVIISHIHWDHADGFDLFPNAKVWIQKEELEYYSGEAWQGKRGAGADAEDIVGLVKLNTEGKVGLVKGDAQEILPGITCYTGGKHTWQSQFIGVKTAAGTVILASDNVYLYENLEKHVPIAATLDADSNLKAQDRMKRLASSEKFIIPGHDAAVMKNFTVVAPGVVRIQ